MSDHLPECPIRRETWCIWPGDKCGKCDDLRNERAAMAELQLSADERQRSYQRGFDDARWLAAKEALEAVQHEDPCDCEPCKAIVRALAELRTIGND